MLLKLTTTDTEIYDSALKLNIKHNWQFFIKLGIHKHIKND